MTVAHEIQIIDQRIPAVIQASLLESVDLAYSRRADQEWLGFVSAAAELAAAKGEPFSPPEHAHWRWERKFSVTERLLSFPTWAVEADGQPQGLMLLKTDGEYGRLPGQAGRPLVYVMFLATAPWNLPQVAPNPRFRGCGLALMRAAVEVGFDLGFKGRIGLHALPQSVAFYTRWGLLSTGADADKGGLPYFEMPEATAAEFIR